MTEKNVFLLLLLFFVLRIGVACFMAESALSYGDAPGYNAYALNILKDSSWLHSSQFSASYREPLYPLFLAVSYFFFGKENFLAVYILQALINTLTVFVIYKFSFKLFGKKTAYIALLYAGLYGFYFLFSAARLIREVLVCFLLILFVYLLYRYLTEPSSHGKLITIALICALLIHTDSRYVYFFPASLPLFILYRNFWQAIRLFAVFILLVAVFSVPWSIRNTITYNKFFLGHMFYLETERAFPVIKIREKHELSLRGVVEQKEVGIAKNKNYPTEEERELIRIGLNPHGRSAAEIEAITKKIYPARTFWGRKWFNLRELWRPFMIGGIYRPLSDGPHEKVFYHWPLKHNLFSIIFYGTLLPFTIIGIVVFAIQRQKAIYFLLIPLFFHTLFHTIVWGQWRFRVPVDSLLIILGSYGIMVMYKFVGAQLSRIKNS